MNQKEVSEAKRILRRWISLAMATRKKQAFIDECRKLQQVLNDLTPGVK